MQGINTTLPENNLNTCIIPRIGSFKNKIFVKTSSHAWFLQACDGSIAQLRQYLVQMNAPSAVNIIDNAQAVLESDERLKSAPLLGARTLLNDSGIDSQSSEIGELIWTGFVHHVHCYFHGLYIYIYISTDY